MHKTNTVLFEKIQGFRYLYLASGIVLALNMEGHLDNQNYLGMMLRAIVLSLFIVFSVKSQCMVCLSMINTNNNNNKYNFGFVRLSDGGNGPCDIDITHRSSINKEMKGRRKICSFSV